MTLGIALQRALAKVDAGIDTYPFRAERQANFTSAAAAVLLVVRVILRSADVQVITRGQVDVTPGLDLRTDDVQVVAGVELDIAPRLDRRTSMSGLVNQAVR